jgi:phage terminase large subunit-like protein
MNLPAHLGWLLQLPPSAREAIRRQLQQTVSYRRLEAYQPYDKQREFHEAGITYRERLLRAANQTGKTWAAAAESAMHLTQRYPSWWRGKVFHTPQVALVASETGLLTRDGVQRVLFGHPVTPLGTGMVPKDAIIDVTKAAHGPADYYEHIRIRHGGGGDVQAGESLLYQRSYDQGRARVQAMTLGWVWLDEEPDDDFYFECLTRTNTTLGPVSLTFTPLKGMSNVVKRFLLDKHVGTTDIHMDISDAGHFTPEQQAAIIASYPEHEREARAHGVPVLGSGRVFTVPEELLRFESFGMAPHWRRIAGMDFGAAHPTAAVWIAHDADTDTAYIYDCYRRKGPSELLPVHAAVIVSKGKWIPMAWPHDGENETAAGPQLAKQYRDHHVNMLPEHAQFLPESDRTNQNTAKARMSVEAGVQMMVNRMLEGRLKVAAHLTDWWEEYRLYHRQDGKIVKLNDDLMSATRYALLCIGQAGLPPRETNKLNPHRRSNWRA